MQPSTTEQQQDAHAPLMAAAIDRVIAWVGSLASLAVHTLAFIGAFAIALAGLVEWSLMLLVLTTVVSLEAIYLAIFIQFTVNRQTASLRGVEADVDSIQEDVEELGQHIESIKEDVEEIQEDINESGEDDAEMLRKKKQAEMLITLTNDVKMLLAHLETLKSS